MFFAVLMLTCLVSATFWTLLTRSAVAASVLLVFGALWLPANNGQLEGHNLLTLSTTHGVTEGDAVGIVGWLIAMAVLLHLALRSERGHVRSERIGAVMLAGLGVLALGAVTAYVIG